MYCLYLSLFLYILLQKIVPLWQSGNKIVYIFVLFCFGIRKIILDKLVLDTHQRFWKLKYIHDVKGFEKLYYQFVVNVLLILFYFSFTEKNQRATAV